MPSPADILALEREFWTTMANGDHQKSADLLAPQAAMVSDMGSISFTPEEYIRMGQSSPFKIVKWSLSDEKVIFPTPTTAVCMYKVDQTLERDGTPETMQNFDTSVWVSDGGGWKCILHTESAAQNAS